VFLQGGFPFREEMQPFNDVCLHPRFLRAAAQCLGTSDVRLVQSGSGKKKYEPLEEGTSGEQMDFIPGEQGLHQDYSNNTLVVPPRPPQLPETMNCIMVREKKTRTQSESPPSPPFLLSLHSFHQVLKQTHAY